MTSFSKFNFKKVLLDEITKNKYTTPTEIQQIAMPHILKQKDIIAISQTGTGKTLAFILPILNDIIKTNQYYHTLILTPTRELAKQIEDEFHKFGKSLGLNIVTLIGGEDEKAQKRAMFSSPHVIVGTPGRLSLVMKSIKLFKKLKFLVLDECDKLLEKNYRDDVFNILENCNSNRQTLLFSATSNDLLNEMSEKYMKEPLRIELNKSLETVEKLEQKYVFLPFKYKEAYLYVFLKSRKERVIVFVNSCLTAQTLCIYLKKMNFDVLALHGDMPQDKRLAVLDDYKKNKNVILIATDVASRGLDIPYIEVVLNYDLPKNSKDYVHRVGRTARAGKDGLAINFVTQYDIFDLQKIEQNIDIRFDKHVMDENEILTFNAQCAVSYKEAYEEIKEVNIVRKAKRMRK